MEILPISASWEKRIPNAQIKCDLCCCKKIKKSEGPVSALSLVATISRSCILRESRGSRGQEWRRPCEHGDVRLDLRTTHSDGPRDPGRGWLCPTSAKVGMIGLLCSWPVVRGGWQTKACRLDTKKHWRTCIDQGSWLQIAESTPEAPRDSLAFR